MQSRRCRGLVVTLAIGLSCGAAAEEFSRSLSQEEFASAGLSKLTPAELARLNALVAERRPEPAKGETARREDKNAAPAGLMERMRVVLKPGTEIAYESVETEIAGEFRGYKPGTVLTLANGQRWRVVDGDFWAPAKQASKRRAVTVEPGMMGSFFLRIEDGGRPKVKYVGMTK